MLRAMCSSTSSSTARHGVIAVATALAIGGAAVRGAQAPASPPARAAMYSEEQATAGETIYRRSCAACHGATPTRGTAPALAGTPLPPSRSQPRVTPPPPVLL